jgi:hypothetical protein
MVEWVSWIQNLQYSLKAEQKAEIQIKKVNFIVYKYDISCRKNKNKIKKVRYILYYTLS